MAGMNEVAFDMESVGLDSTSRLKLEKKGRGYESLPKSSSAEDILVDEIANSPVKKEKENKASQLLDNHSFGEVKETSNSVWSSLPDSINGTLIYFLLVEHNAKNFPFIDIVCWLFTLGLPVYLSFYIQLLFIYWIYQVSPEFNDSPLCEQDPFLQHAVICIFFIFMYPSVTSICIETYVLLRSDRVGFTHEEVDNRILLYKLYSPMSKRLFLFFMIPFIETIVLTSLYFVGSKFIITSDDVSDLIINSVAIAFIMDVDNLAREYFQSDEVTEHVDGMHFETKMQAMEAKLTSIDDVHSNDVANDEEPEEKVVNPEVVATFWSLEKVVMVIGIGAVYIICLRGVYCGDNGKFPGAHDDGYVPASGR